MSQTIAAIAPDSPSLTYDPLHHLLTQVWGPEDVDFPLRNASSESENRFTSDSTDRQSFLNHQISQLSQQEKWTLAEWLHFEALTYQLNDPGRASEFSQQISSKGFIQDHYVLHSILKVVPASLHKQLFLSWPNKKNEKLPPIYFGSSVAGLSLNLAAGLINLVDYLKSNGKDNPDLVGLASELAEQSPFTFLSLVTNQPSKMSLTPLSIRRYEVIPDRPDLIEKLSLYSPLHFNFLRAFRSLLEADTYHEHTRGIQFPDGNLSEIILELDVDLFRSIMQSLFFNPSLEKEGKKNCLKFFNNAFTKKEKWIFDVREWQLIDAVLKLELPSFLSFNEISWDYFFERLRDIKNWVKEENLSNSDDVFLWNELGQWPTPEKLLQHPEQLKSAVLLACEKLLRKLSQARDSLASSIQERAEKLSLDYYNLYKTDKRVNVLFLNRFYDRYAPTTFTQYIELFKSLNRSELEIKKLFVQLRKDFRNHNHKEDQFEKIKSLITQGAASLSFENQEKLIKFIILGEYWCEDIVCFVEILMRPGILGFVSNDNEEIRNLVEQLFYWFNQIRNKNDALQIINSVNNQQSWLKIPGQSLAEKMYYLRCLGESDSENVQPESDAFFYNDYYNYFGLPPILNEYLNLESFERLKQSYEYLKKEYPVLLMHLRKGIRKSLQIGNGYSVTSVTQNLLKNQKHFPYLAFLARLDSEGESKFRSSQYLQKLLPTLLDGGSSFIRMGATDFFYQSLFSKLNDIFEKLETPADIAYFIHSYFFTPVEDDYDKSIESVVAALEKETENPKGLVLAFYEGLKKNISIDDIVVQFNKEKLEKTQARLGSVFTSLLFKKSNRLETSQEYYERYLKLLILARRFEFNKIEEFIINEFKRELEIQAPYLIQCEIEARKRWIQEWETNKHLGLNNSFLEISDEVKAEILNNKDVGKIAAHLGLVTNSRIKSKIQWPKLMSPQASPDEYDQDSRQINSRYSHLLNEKLGLKIMDSLFEGEVVGSMRQLSMSLSEFAASDELRIKIIGPAESSPVAGRILEIDEGIPEKKQEPWHEQIIGHFNYALHSPGAAVIGHHSSLPFPGFLKIIDKNKKYSYQWDSSKKSYELQKTSSYFGNLQKPASRFAYTVKKGNMTRWTPRFLRT